MLVKDVIAKFRKERPPCIACEKPTTFFTTGELDGKQLVIPLCMTCARILHNAERPEVEAKHRLKVA